MMSTEFSAALNIWPDAEAIAWDGDHAAHVDIRIRGELRTIAALRFFDATLSEAQAVADAINAAIAATKAREESDAARSHEAAVQLMQAAE
jgi:hypothetical protein